jgi:hypothetical protein
MTDTEALAGYLFLYLARRTETARNPMDWAGEQLYALVAKKLEDDPALRELADEANAGQGAISPVTQRRMTLALVAATEHDPKFARALAIHLQKCERRRRQWSRHARKTMIRPSANRLSLPTTCGISAPTTPPRRAPATVWRTI